MNGVGTPVNSRVVLSQPGFAENDVKTVQRRDYQCAFLFEFRSEEEWKGALVSCGGDGTVCQLYV